jgi:hypothetical protein
MNCFECDATAVAVCKFCGNAVCHDHRAAGRYVTGWRGWGARVMTEWGEDKADLLIIPEAAWCGRCAVQHVTR